MILDKQDKRSVFSDVRQSATADFPARHQSSEEISAWKKRPDQELCILDIELVLVPNVVTMETVTETRRHLILNSPVLQVTL